MFFGTYTPGSMTRADCSSRRSSGTSWRRDSWSHEGRSAASTCGPMEEFGKLTERLRETPVTNKAARDYVRMFFAGASDETPDKQGRITVPPMLRDYAALDEGLRGDRRDEPDRDLGRRVVADLLGPAGAGVRGPVGRGLPRRLSQHRSPARPAAPTTRTAGVVGRGLASAHRCTRLAHLPRCQKGLPQRRAGGDLVRRTRHVASTSRTDAAGVEPCPRITEHRPGSDTRGIATTHARAPTRSSPPRAPGPPGGPRRRRGRRLLGHRLHRRRAGPARPARAVAG